MKIISKTLENSLSQTIRDLKSRIQVLEGQETQADELDEMAFEAGAQSFGDSSFDESGLHVQADLIGVNWWMPCGLASDAVTLITSLYYDATNNRMWVGGLFNSIGGVKAESLAYCDLYTGRWTGITGLGTSVQPLVWKIGQLSSGMMVIAGNFTTAGGVANATNLAYLDPTTKVWTAVSANPPNGKVSDLIIADNDDIYIAGAFTTVGGSANGKSVAMFDYSTSTWTYFASGITLTWSTGKQAIAIDGDGLLYFAGNFTNGGGVSGADYLIRWNGVAWELVGASGYWTNGAYTHGTVRTSIDGNVYFSGISSTEGLGWNIYQIRDATITNITTPHYLGGSHPEALDIIDCDEGILIAGGFESMQDLEGAVRIAYWENGDLSALDQYGIRADTGVGSDSVACLAIDGKGNIWAGGEFDVVQNWEANSLITYRISLSEAFNWMNSRSDVADERYHKSLIAIGGLYFNATGTDPATELGYGTWTAWGTGRVPVMYDATDSDFNAAEKTGGAKTVSHDHSHSHSPGSLHARINIGNSALLSDRVGESFTYDRSATLSGGDSSGSSAYATDVAGSTGTDATSATPSVVQPYIVLFAWKRTA